MATTTATITLASADMMDNSLSISNTATLYTAGTNTGITETTGLSRKKFATASEFKLLDFGLAGSQMADVTADKSAKVYIKNLNDRGDGTKYVAVLINSIEIGRLYGGDWCFFPWSGGNDKDIDIDPYDATETTLEYTCFFE
mgnify:CR=1 FL=1|tara:strand:- start:386 stop:811 length:426 start_codon:yes stop_codon:yes gene_type:complete